ncbi:hypothetical protein FHS16_003655 [Paenibacillus endophyticus]|uniref:DUF4436 domain-containing protein n=1 Tax=Paenibacillus endophyticus TaxID=1294268 RepID=A0A7W5GB98_9BACL|nr:hypothetical protein [Paenibacillus endophyticus]MBB3153580.1 hypothetical protein [Paenibacillus endophyticus]
MLRIRIPAIFIAAILMLLIGPATAGANGGPLYEPAEGYGLLQLDEHSKVSLVQEKVLFKIGKSVNDYMGQADITVSYELHNKSNERKDIRVLFLTPSKEALTVTESGEQVAVSLAHEAKPANWQAAVTDTVTDPVSGKAIRLNQGWIGNQAPVGTQFPLSFGPDETKHIVIQYAEGGGLYEKGIIHKIRSHQYYLTPAEFWEGEPNVELEVQLYAAGAKLHSNLPMEKSSSTVYKASFRRLPSEDWYFSYVFSSRLLFPTNIESEHNLLTLGTAVILATFAACLALLLRKSYIFTISMLGILAFTVYYISRMGGYPFNFIFVALTDILVGVSLVICDVFIRKSIRRRRLGGT